MSFPVEYDRATGPTTGPAPGAVALMAWATDGRFPRATNLGIYNPRRVRGSLTAWSVHAEGRAVDVGFPIVAGGHSSGHQLATHLVDHHEGLGVQQVIWARQSWRNTRNGWRHYNGASDHLDHVHAELTRAAGLGLTTEMIEATTRYERPDMYSSIVAAYQVGGRLPTPAEARSWVLEIRAKGHNLDDACDYIAHVVASER